MPVAASWQLHPVHLDLVHSYLGLDGDLDDLTLPLRAASYGATGQQVGQVGQSEVEAMQALGILKGDEVNPQLVEALQALTKPYLWVTSVWFPQSGSAAVRHAVAVVTQGNRIVLAVQSPGGQPPGGDSEPNGGMLTVEVHAKSTLSHALLPTLPPAQPGNRGGASVPASILTGATSTGDDQPSSVPSGQGQLARYREIAAAERVRVGQIAANTRDHTGRIHQSQVVTWFDNAEPDGRYLSHNECANSGEPVCSVAPADARLLGTKIEGLVRSVR